MSKNHDASNKNLEMQIGQISRQLASLPSSSGGFTGNTIDNRKTETYKAVEIGFEVITSRGEDEIVEVRTETEESKNQGDQAEKGVTIEQLIDKNSPRRRTKR